MKNLRSRFEEQDRLQYLKIINELEEKFKSGDKKYFVESGKAWNAIHRSLTDSKLSWDGGVYPLNHVILGGEPLYTSDHYLVILKTPKMVHDMAAALPYQTQYDFMKRYFAIDPESYGMEPSEEDYAYIWDRFENVRTFYLNLAEEKRYVLFAASQ